MKSKHGIRLRKTVRNWRDSFVISTDSSGRIRTPFSVAYRFSAMPLCAPDCSFALLFLADEAPSRKPA